jgi:Flp pilus assembly protein TadG
MMRRGVVEQIMMLMMVFVFLVTLFFLIVDYSSIGKVQNQLDMMSRQGSRLISLGKDQEKVVNMVNALKTNYFQAITIDDINCIIAENEQSKVIFNIQGSFQSRFDGLGSSGEVVITSISVAYNENNSDEMNCSVVLQKMGDV